MYGGFVGSSGVHVPFPCCSPLKSFLAFAQIYNNPPILYVLLGTIMTSHYHCQIYYHCKIFTQRINDCCDANADVSNRGVLVYV